jgi:hypothetical protein
MTAVEQQLNASEGRPNALRPRSAVTSGRRLFADTGDPNSAWARRFHDLYNGYLVQFGVVDPAEQVLARGAARIAVMLELEDARAANGAVVDLGDVARATSRLQRILRDLAASARARKRGLA